MFLRASDLYDEEVLDPAAIRQARIGQRAFIRRIGAGQGNLESSNLESSRATIHCRRTEVRHRDLSGHIDVDCIPRSMAGFPPAGERPVSDGVGRTRAVHDYFPLHKRPEPLDRFRRFARAIHTGS
jgi:hypothetical protein